MARSLLSHSSRRLLATLAALFALAAMPIVARGVALPPSTWVGLAPLPNSNAGTIFGLAVDPTNSAHVIAGDATGAIYSSDDAGTTWSRVFAANGPVLTIAFDPLVPQTVIAGTQGRGLLSSNDSGAHWRDGVGLDRRTVHSVAFTQAAMFAATNDGVYRSTDATSWTQSGLSNIGLDSVAALTINDPVRLVAGGDTAGTTIPLYGSLDGGSTWSELNPSISGTIITTLGSGPPATGSSIRPLIAGTNTGLFISEDGAATFTPLSGAQRLPSLDYTQAAFTASHFDRLYVASDGGGGGTGGLWATADSGQHFSSLQPPEHSITALAVSADEQPVLYVATFRAYDHAASLWAYRDTGGAPQGPFIFVSPTATPARTGGSGGSIGDFFRSLGSSQVPYIAVGAVALGLILLAAISHFRSRRR